MVNVGFFTVSLLVSIIIKLGIPGFEIANYYGASSNFMEVLFKPWTLVTYMFAHSLFGIGHLFWNMIMLYFAGTFFVNKLGNKKLLSLYLVGGFAGFFLFTLGFNFLPAFSMLSEGFLVGASASVTAILVVIGVLYPNHEIKLMFIPQPIKLIYIVGFFILLDIIKLQSSIGLEGANQGGWLSHLGGAFFGFFYATRMKQGKNSLRRFEAYLDNLFSFNFSKYFVKNKKSKLKVEKGGKQKTESTRKTDKLRKESINDILSKVKNSGYESLTRKEKDLLFSQTKK
jgi:membrane associated rhomboid family serine protease